MLLLKDKEKDIKKEFRNQVKEIAGDWSAGKPCKPFHIPIPCEGKAKGHDVGECTKDDNKKDEDCEERDVKEQRKSTFPTFLVVRHNDAEKTDKGKGFCGIQQANVQNLFFGAFLDEGEDQVKYPDLDEKVFDEGRVCQEVNDAG